MMLLTRSVGIQCWKTQSTGTSHHDVINKIGWYSVLEDTIYKNNLHEPLNMMLLTRSVGIQCWKTQSTGTSHHDVINKIGWYSVLEDTIYGNLSP